jgi:hypothetical protein
MDAKVQPREPKESDHPDPSAQRMLFGGLDWVWWTWFVHLGVTIFLGAEALRVAAHQPVNGMFWFVCFAAAGWLLAAATNSAIVRGKVRWFLAMVITLVNPFIFYVFAGELTQDLHRALIASIIFVAMTIVACSQLIAPLVLLSGVSTCIFGKVVLGEIGIHLPMNQIMPLAGAYTALAGVAVAWRFFLVRMRRIFVGAATEQVMRSNLIAVRRERDAMRAAIARQIAAMDRLLARSSDAAGVGE